MKYKLILLLPVVALWLNSCASGEYHTVTLYERTHHVAAAPTDDPRAFVPKERF